MTQKSTLGAPGLARLGLGQAGEESATVRPILPGNAVQGWCSVSAIYMVPFLCERVTFLLSSRAACPQHAAKSDMAHAGVDHLRLARRRPVTQAIIGGAQVRAALDHFAWNAELRLTRIVAFVRRDDAWIDCRSATGFDDLVGMTMDVPVARPFPHVAGHVVQPIAIGWKRTDRSEEHTSE